MKCSLKLALHVKSFLHSENFQRGLDRVQSIGMQELVVNLLCKYLSHEFSYFPFKNIRLKCICLFQTHDYIAYGIFEFTVLQ